MSIIYKIRDSQPLIFNGLTSHFIISLIFKTIETDAKDATVQLSIFGRSLQQISSYRSYGIGLKDSLFGNTDINALRSFEAEWQKCGSYVQAYKITMTDAGEEAKKHAVQMVKTDKTVSDFSAATKQATLSTKALNLGLKALSIAGNMLLTMGISFAISAVIKGLDNLIHAGEKTKERADEMTQSLKSFQSETNSSSKTINDLSDKYQQLSQKMSDGAGITQLTTAERDEYRSICNQIGEIMPNLIKAYDTEGNAILTLKGNVDELTEAYRQNIQAKANQFLTQGDNNGNTIQDMLDDYSNYRQGTGSGVFKDAEGYRRINGTDTLSKGLKELSTANYEDFLKILENSNKLSKGEESELTEYVYYLLRDKEFDSKSVSYMLRRGEDDTVIKENFNEIHKIIESALDTIESDTNAHAANIRSILQQIAYGDNGYWNLDNKDLQDSINEFIGSLSFDFVNNNGLTDEISMRKFVSNIIDSISQNKDEFADAWKGLFDLKDNANIPAEQYISQAESFIDTLGNVLGLDKNGKKELMISLGFDIEEPTNLINNVKSKLKDEFRGKVDNMTLEDLVDASKLEVPEGTLLTWDEFIKKMAEAKATASNFSLDSFNKSIDDIQSAYNTLTKAKDEWNKNGTYSLDTVQALLALEPKYLAMLVNENGQLKLNEQAMYDLVNAQLEDAKSKVYQSAINELNALAEKKAGDASAWSAQVRKEGIIDINAETDAISKNTTATMMNEAAKKALDTPGVSEEEVNAIVSKYTNIANSLGSVMDGLSFDFDGVVGGFSDMKEKLDDLAKSEALTKLKYKFDQIEQSITKVDNAISLLNNTLDLTAENDYETKLYTTSRMLELAQQKSALLRDEFAQLDAQEYSSADTANEIATRMKSVADSIAENNKNIINYSKSIAEYYTSALTSVSSLSKTTIDEATNLLDRNIKSLSEGGLTGLQFNLSPTIPKSALDKQREQNRSMEAEMQSYYDTVAKMQKVALDLEYQEQMQSYAEQRAELDSTLNKSKTNIENTAKDIQTETKEFTKEEQTTLNNLHDWIKNNPLEAPTLADSWDNRVTEIEDWAKRVQKALGGISPEPWSDSLGNASPKLSSNKVLNTAAAFNGTPYVWGGTNLTDKGLDCSGYIYQVLKKLGYTGERTTADGFRKVGSKIDKSEMQPGDLLFFDYGHDGEADHIGIYAGNNQMWHSSGNSSNTADNPGKGVHLADITSFYANALMQVNRNPYVKAYAKGTKPFDYNGVAGEDKPEYLIDKKTGKMTRIDSPTLINTDEVDVVSQNDTARAERHKYAKGTIKVPDGLGKSYTYMNWDTITNMDTEQGRLIKSAGKSYDSEGYGKIGERYALAMTSTFGKIGDCVDIYMSNGRVIQGILADEKSQIATAWDSNPANEWGHDNGQSMVEFVTNWKNHDNPMSDGTVVRVENLGSYFDSPQLANDISATADNTSKIASIDFESELRNITENKSVSSNESIYQGNILDYIRENADLGRDITEELVSSFDALQAYQNSKRETFDGYRQQLANAVNTDDFAPLREQITDEIVKYADNVVKVSNDITVQSIKDSFDQAQDIQDTILAYFNKRKSEGANADELKVIQDAYNTQSKIVQEYSDQYVSTMSAYTDYIVGIVEKEMQSFSDRVSWKDRAIENLEHRLDKTDDPAEKSRITNDIIALDNDKIVIYEEQKTTAHQKAMDMRNDESFTDLFKQFGWDDIETWFDANGEFSAKFTDDIKALGADENTAYLVADMRRLAEGIQACKKGWYEADEAVLNLKDHSEELAEAEADRKLETYINGQERLADIIDYQAEKQQRLIDAQDKSYKMTQSLRNAQAEIDKEIRDNMELAEWLDDDTRKLLFNEDDYAAETKAIQGIQSEMDRLTANYRKDISDLGEEDWYQEKALTAEYERQIDALNEKLDVAKQTLGVAKKQAEYENRAKERDTQIILGNRVVNVADPEAMHKIALEKSEAEIALSNTEKTNAENQNVRDLQKDNDQTEQEAASIQNRIDMINSMTDAEKQVFSDFLEPIEVLTAKLNALKYADPNYLIENDNSDKLANKHAPVNKGASLGYSLTEDHSQFVKYLLKGVRGGIMSLDEAKVYLDREREQHNYKTSTDPHNSGYNQYTGVNQYDENLIKTYDADKRVLADDPEYNKIAEEIAAGKYRIVEPEEMIINVSNLPELMKMGVPDNIIREHMQKMVGKVPTNIVTTQNTNSNPTIDYNFSGDIILTEAITNGTEFVQSLAYKIGEQYPTIKNTKI